MEMEKIEKLVVSSHDKTEYVMHITILKQIIDCLNLVKMLD